MINEFLDSICKAAYVSRIAAPQPIQRIVVHPALFERLADHVDECANYLGIAEPRAVVNFCGIEIVPECSAEIVGPHSEH